MRSEEQLNMAMSKDTLSHVAVNNAQARKLDVDSLPHDMIGFLSRSAVGRSSLYKLENGIQLSPAEEQFLRSLNTQNGIKDKNGLSLLISFLDKFSGK